MQLDYQLRDMSVKAGKVMDRIIVVTDLTGLSLGLLTPYNIGIYKKQLAVAEKNFPERVWKVRIINPPSIFATAFELVKDSFDEGTRAKIDILRDPKALFDLIDEDNVPEYLGGRMRVMGDPFCRFNIKGTTELVKVPQGIGCVDSA